MNEIINLCKGYKKLDKNDNLFNLLEPFYNKEKTKPLRCANSWKMVHESQSNTAILALHGYTGYPGEMIYPALKLFESGFDVYCPRYPGHGVDAEDFLNTNGEDWLNVARVALGYLKKEYNEVFVIGHSMGGLIATIVANEFEIDKIGLISPAYYIAGFSYTKIKILSLFKSVLEKPWKSDRAFWGICEREENDDEILGKRYWSKIYVNQVLELNKLRNKALNILPKYEGEAFSVIGDKDDAIDINKVVSFLKKYNVKTMLLEGSNHLSQYFSDETIREKCNDSIVDFLKD